MNKYQQSQQVFSQFVPFEQLSNIVVYKIFGKKQFSFQQAFAPSIQDWSAFYTQYSSQHSMRYLTKKWSDGADFGSLVKIRFKNTKPQQAYKKIGEQKNNSLKNPQILKILRVKHSIFGKHQISGYDKANLLKNHLKQKYDIQFFISNKQIPLMKRLGELGILLQCVDCEDEELIIPHDLLNETNFSYQGCLQLKRSDDGMLRTIGWRKYQNKAIDQQTDNQNWNKVYGNQQFQPYLLIQNNQEIIKIIQQK